MSLTTQDSVSPPLTSTVNTVLKLSLFWNAFLMKFPPKDTDTASFPAP